MLRPLVSLALVLALALAGCIGKGQEAPAAVEEPVSSQSAATEEETSSTATAPTAPTPSSAPASGANATAPASAPTPSPPPAAPPKPAPWNLTEATKLGWAAAAGARADPVEQAHEQGQKDAEHCPDATFVLPAGATEVVVAAAQAYAQPTPGAGAMRIVITDPEGVAIAIEPQPGPGSTVVAKLSDPKAGPWALHAEPVGPVVAQTWGITLDAKGASLAALPTTLALVTTC